MDRISMITALFARALVLKSIGGDKIEFIGVTTTALTDGATTNPITIDSDSVTAVSGNVAIYGNDAFIFNGTEWQIYSDMSDIETRLEEAEGDIDDIELVLPTKADADSVYTKTETDTLLSAKAAASDLTATDLRVTALESHVTQTGDIIDNDAHSLHITASAIETEKTVSGNPIVITDALPVPAKSLETTINAIQDLHGLPFPYVGGAYKNKLPMTVASIKAANTTGTWSGNVYTLNDVVFTMQTDSADNVIGFKVNGTNSANATTSLILYNSSTVPDVIKGQSIALNGCPSGLTGSALMVNSWGSADPIYDTGSGASATFPATPNGLRAEIQVNIGATVSNAQYKPMLRLSTESDASFAPYSNICPISGRDSVAVDDEGKNQLPKYTNSSFTASGITFTQDENGVVDADGTATATVLWRQLFNFKGGRYILSGGVSSNNFVGIQNTGSIYVAQATATESAAFDLPEGQYYKSIRIGNGETVNHAKYYPMLRDASISDNTYEPYTTSSATIQLGTTVYGADINWDTGVMSITNVITDLGNYTWTYHDTLHQFYAYFPSDAPDNISGGRDGICSAYAVAHNTTLEALKEGELTMFNSAYGSGKTMWIKDSRYSDATQYKTAVTGYKLVYPLATPTTIQLTPTQLQMLKGYNRVSIEDGTITLTYRANKADSVQAEVDVLETTKADNADVVDYIENGNTASRAYTANQFMLWKGDLYKVTTSIASGATITAGTNVSKTTIGAVLTALLNA